MEIVRPEWFADDGFWSIMYPFMFSSKRMETGAEHVEQIIERTDCREGAVLDTCCGPGRHAIPFSQRGFKVTGVDRSDFLLNRGRERAATADTPIEWAHEDIRAFVRPEAYDLAVNLGGSFGYCDAPEDNQRVLSNVYQSLRRGGVFVLDTLGKELLAARFEETASEELPDGGCLFQRRRIVNEWRAVESEWLLIQDSTVHKFGIRLWIYSGAELRDLLLSVGFSEVQLFGDLSGRTYGRGAKRLVALARK